MIDHESRAGRVPPEPGSEPAGELFQLELHLLLEGVVRLSGFDFREYALTGLRRRVAERMRSEHARSITGLLEALVHDPPTLERFLHAMTTAANMPFRDVVLLRAFAADVIPRLRTYPFVRLWVAGNGLDAYAIAILLHEAGLLERVRIYATEATNSGLAQAKAGAVSADLVRSAEERYRESGGRRTFAEYLQPAAGGFSYDPFLTQSIVFARHHLAGEGSFNEFQAVIVRAPLGAYGKALAYRVHQTLYASVARFGFLMLPESDATFAGAHRLLYEPLPESDTVFRRIR